LPVIIGKCVVVQITVLQALCLSAFDTTLNLKDIQMRQNML